MGVKGLQTFLKNNVDVFAQRIDLSNANLVIDANNLLINLFTSYCLDSQDKNYRNDLYDGDFVEYGNHVKRFFTNVIRCSIKPILIFDGSVIGDQSKKDEIVLKDKETYRRGLDKFNAVKIANENQLFNYNSNDSVLLPKLLKSVFNNIAKDYNIEIIQTPFEADKHLALVANQYDCSVLTNDSDFIIYPLNRGFILLDYFDYQNTKRTRDNKFNCIGCHVFSQTLLIKRIPNLMIETMPLLSILAGNDYVDANLFKDILRHVCAQAYLSTFRADSYNHRKIAGILVWLKGKSYNGAIEEILQLSPSHMRDALKKTFKILTRNYDLTIEDNLKDALSTVYTNRKSESTNIGQEDETVVVYLNKLFNSYCSSPNLLDIIFKNTDYNYPIIDDFQLPLSSCYIKWPLLRLAVTLLRPKDYTDLTTYAKRIQSQEDSLRIFDRVDGEYREALLEPLESLEGFGSLEHINAYTMINLPMEVKREILMAALKFNKEEANLVHETLCNVFSVAFAKDATLCFILVKYCGQESKSKPKPQFVEALMLTLFYYAALQQQLKPDTFKDAQYGQYLMRLRPHTYTRNGIEYKPSVGLFRRILHFISQLQYAYSGYSMINELLGDVWFSSRVEKFFNGVLIFRLTKLLRLNELNIRTLLDDMTIVCDVCDTIKLLVDCEPDQ